MSNVELDAGWYADPHGRAIQRYWNGVAWTSDVVDASGQQRVEGQDRTNAELSAQCIRRVSTVS